MHMFRKCAYKRNFNKLYFKNSILHRCVEILYYSIMSYKVVVFPKNDTQKMKQFCILHIIINFSKIFIILLMQLSIIDIIIYLKF